MSLHNMVCSKSKPVYQCIKSIQEDRKGLTFPTLNEGCILGTFHLSWEYPIEYVKKRIPNHLIENHFKLLT